ncbi:MAG TPA: complex I NDUFA9 subunit family protein [Gammaproteobacteria bacterium]|nr:complex I NDUFA9 subunit family protein [Gammaproteobacteria bacterium]
MSIPTALRSSRVLVLGGTGFVGRRLVQRLLDDGYDIRIPTRSRARNRRLLVSPGIELLEADVHDDTRLRELLDGCRAAINLVGILNEPGHDGAGFERAHAELTAKLVRACRDADVPRVLQMSALKADAERGPSHYLRSKGRAERLLATGAGDSIAYTVFRPSVIFGAEDSLLNRFATLLRIAPVLPLAGADARFAPVFVDDVAEAFARSLANPATWGKTYELCGPEIYSLEEIVRLVRAQLGLRRAIVKLPSSLSRIEAWLGEYVLPGKPFSRDNLASLGVPSLCTNDGLAELGIHAHALSSIAPTYLGAGDRQRELTRLRRSAGRG